MLCRLGEWEEGWSEAERGAQPRQHWREQDQEDLRLPRQGGVHPQEDLVQVLYTHGVPKNFILPLSVVDTDAFGPPGSASGSVSHKYGSGSFYHSAKVVKKTLISTVLWLLYDFLPVFRIRIRRIHMFLGLSDPHSNSLDRGTDPRIWIRIRNRTIKSRIHNTASLCTSSPVWMFIQKTIFSSMRYVHMFLFLLCRDLVETVLPSVCSEFSLSCLLERNRLLYNKCQFISWWLFLHV